MKKVFVFFVLVFAGISSFSQVKSIMLDGKDRITPDSSLAVTYAVFGKLTGDTVYTFKKFDFTGVLLASGSFKDDSLSVPHGKFVYYDWITPENNTVNTGFEINGKERYIQLTGNFIDGNKTGRWLTYYPDGKFKQIVTYYKGVPHGAYQYYNMNGKLMVSGLYVAGKKNGTWTLNGGKQENEYVADQLISTLKGKKLREKQQKVKM